MIGPYGIYVAVGCLVISEQLTRDGVRAIEDDVRRRAPQYDDGGRWRKIVTGTISFVICAHLWPIIIVGKVWNLLKKRGA